MRSLGMGNVRFFLLFFHQAGHTHNELDQRFSSVASLLSRAPVLECPCDFVDWIQRHINAPRGRSLLVQVLESTMNFSSWLETVGSKITGLTATHWNPDANHLWRFTWASRYSM